MPTSHPFELQLRVPAHPVSVALARHAVRALGGVVSSAATQRGEMVVSELVTNAIVHGSRAGDGEVVVELSADRDGITGTVHDHGPAFEIPHGAPDPYGDGGLGLHIVTELTSSVSVTREDEANHVRFRL